MSPNSAEYLTFLDKLAKNEIVEEFTSALVFADHKSINDYYKMGGRWVGVQSVLGGFTTAEKIFMDCGIGGTDHCSLLSPHQLMAQYIPYEDYINNGTAIVMFCLPMNAQWLHVVWVSNEQELMSTFI